MPGGDRTGPMGRGSMTGRAMGYCSGASAPGFANSAYGRGFGRGGGGGIGFGGGRRGCRNMFYATGQPGWMRGGGYAGSYGPAAPLSNPDPEMEKQALGRQAQALQSQLDWIRKRLSEMESEPQNQ